MRTFIGFGQAPYIGIPQAQSIKLSGVSAAIVPLLIQWFSYGASSLNPKVNILCDLRTKECSKLDQIRSVYIDNLGSAVPIYVYFPDSGYTCVAKPNSEGWYPAFTNDKLFWVIGQGFLTGSIPQTSIIVCNTPIFPNVNAEIENAVALWRASPVITRGNSIYNTNLGIPALGDQTFNYVPTLTLGVLITNLWGTPQPAGTKIFLTHINIQYVGMQAIVPTDASLVLNIESTGPSGVLYTFNTPILKGRTVDFVTLLNLSAMNIQLAGDEQWQVRGVSGLNFTQNPIANMTFNWTTAPP